MNIDAIIHYIKSYVATMDMTLHEAASEELIQKMEQVCCISLPEDIKAFYKFTNGFEVDDDLFNIIPLEEVISNTKRHKKDIYIAEYMTYSDMWGLAINPYTNTYLIYNDNRYGERVILTDSFAEFLGRFFSGGVFEEGGLYEWGEGMRPNK
jgi:hypothetical protein